MFCSVPDSLCPFCAFCVFSVIPFVFFSSCVSLPFAYLSTFVSLFVCTLSRISRHSSRAHFRHSFPVLSAFVSLFVCTLPRISSIPFVPISVFPFVFFSAFVSLFVCTLSRISGIPFAPISDIPFAFFSGFVSHPFVPFPHTFPVLLSSPFAFRHGVPKRIRNAVCEAMNALEVPCVCPLSEKSNVLSLLFSLWSNECFRVSLPSVFLREAMNDLHSFVSSG